MSKPRARRATARPMRPIPKMPRRFPVTCTPSIIVECQPTHSPARTIRSPSAPRRAAPSRQSIATSAVASLRTSGVLVTTMPRAFAASTAMCS